MKRQPNAGCGLVSAVEDDSAGAVTGTIDFQYQDAFVMSVRLRAENHGAARARLRALIESDTVFRQELVSAMTLKAARQGVPAYRIRDVDNHVDELPADKDYEIDPECDGEC